MTRCSEKRRRRLSPSRRIARAVRMGASVRKAPCAAHRLRRSTEGEIRGGDHGGWERRSRARIRDGFGQAGDEDTGQPCRRAGGSRGGPGGRERPKGSLAFARPRKAKAAAAIMEAGSAEAEPESETALGKRGDEDAGADPIVVPAAGATAVANGAEFGVGSAGPATAAAKPRRPLFARNGAIAVVLLTGVAAAAIMVLNWPHGSHPQAVEPGMLADQPTKVMAPSAALATVPPREEPNVAGERPQVHETRRDEFQEVLSFKGLRATASPPPASPPPTPSPVGGPVTVAKPAVPTARAGALRLGRRLRSSPRCRRPRPPRPLRSRNPGKSRRSRHPLRLPPLSRPSPLRLSKQPRSPVLARRRRLSRALTSSRRR